MVYDQRVENDFKRPPLGGPRLRFTFDLTALEKGMAESLARRTKARSTASMIRYCIRLYYALMEQQDKFPNAKLAWVSKGRATQVKFPSWDR